MNENELSRVEQFNQFKKEIRGSSKHLIIGIDVGKDNHHAYMGTATGKSLLRRLIFENNISGFGKLSTQCEAIRVQNALQYSVFGLEPTGNYHKPLAEHLIGCMRNVVLVSGVAVKRNRELLDGRWDKHDTKCAANIADLISQGKCLFYETPSPQIRQLRELMSLRRRLKKEQHSLKMRIRNNLLAKYFPELDRFYGQCESQILDIIRECLNPSEIAGMEFDQFYKALPARKGNIAQLKRLIKIHHLAYESVGCELGEAGVFEARMLVDKLRAVGNRIEETEDLIEDISLDFAEYSWLLTIPGFGPYISAFVLATIGNPFRFANRQQILKMSGYDLNAVRSGKKSDTVVPKISKRGNAALRYALYQAAFVASTRNLAFVQYYTRLLEGREREQGIKTKMRVKIAAKMLVIAWTIMKRKEPFNPDCLKNE